MTKPQCPKLDQNSRRGRRERRLGIGHWAFFGHWSLRPYSSKLNRKNSAGHGDAFVKTNESPSRRIESAATSQGPSSEGLRSSTNPAWLVDHHTIFEPSPCVMWSAGDSGSIRARYASNPGP